MKKQIRFSSIQSRLFAATIDITIFYLLTFPLTRFFNQKLFVWYFGDLLSKRNIDINNINETLQYFLNPSNINVEELQIFYQYLFLSLGMSYIILGICYCSCWLIWRNTIGKALMRIEIKALDSTSYPTKQQFIKRYIGYIFSVFNIFIMPFDKRTRGVHDFLAGTVVVRR